jgi:hypothetical protein
VINSKINWKIDANIEMNNMEREMVVEINEWNEMWLKWSGIVENEKIMTREHDGILEGEP